MSSNDPQPDAILAVRLPAHLRDALKAQAEAHQRSMSGQVRWLIEQSLAASRGIEREAA